MEHFNDLFDINLKKISNSNIIKCISVFNSLYQTNNVTRTAILLNTTKSSISKYLSRLEYIIKKRLFYRKGCKGLITTKEGQDFYNYAKKLLSSLNIITDFISQTNEQKLIISAHPLAYKPYIFPILKNLTQKQIILNIDFFDSLKDKLYAMYADIAICPLEIEKANLIDKNKYEVIQCAEYQLFLYMHKNHILAQKKEEDWTIDDLQLANIVPIESKSTFVYFKNFFSLKEQKIVTTDNNLYFIYQGMLNNLWSLGAGIEFEQFVKIKKNIIIKKEYKKSKFIGNIIYWFIFVKKEILKDKTMCNFITKLKNNINQSKV